MTGQIEVGGPAPELELVGSDRTTRRLTDISEPVVLYMMRAYT